MGGTVVSDVASAPMFPARQGKGRTRPRPARPAIIAAVEETADTMDATQHSRVSVIGDPLRGVEGDAGLELSPGAKVGRYRVLRELGRGGEGVVYAVAEGEGSGELALKLSLAPNAEALREHSLGARRLATVGHPNVVTVVDAGSIALDGGGRGEGQALSFLVMERLEGPTLREWIDAEAPKLEALCRVFGQIAEGLLATHERGLVHGDVKPENVCITPGRVVLFDFGLARSFAEASEAERQECQGGTRIYMAPELLWRLASSSPRSDQFSFCVALWEALYGARPFESRDIREGPPSAPETRESASGGRRERVPRALRKALTQGLAVDPERRHESMSGLTRALDAGASWWRRTWG